MNSKLFTVASLLVLLALASPSGCRKHDTEKPEPKPADPVVMKREAEAARRSLDGLKPALAVQNAKFAELHREFDPLPPGLPGFGETRGSFYAVDEGLGRLNTKLSWLSGRIDAAVQAGNLAELQQVSKDIARTSTDIQKVERLGLELAEQVRPFQQEAVIKLERLQALGKTTCE
ncbi:MAG TPA: hypothetical protein VHP33_21565 [Polyangiaceae bacterium]|nr:hypothetical protein [Polyangiaceae bacterium]